MGDKRSTRETFREETKKKVADDGPATKKAEQKAHETGKLNSLVDPAEFGVIRRSLMRFDPTGDGSWIVTVGTPVPISVWLDTTSSMGGAVDEAIKALGDSYEMCSMVLPDYDLQLATGIFGDIDDRFIMCRPQYEMEAAKIVEQLTLMVPERKGGDIPEDPHYALFGSVYLRQAYINQIGLKGYNFLVSDAPGRDRLSVRQLLRIYGDEVFAKVSENGYQINQDDLPTTKEIVGDLLKIDHAFFLQVRDDSETTDFWTKVYGKNRVIKLPSASYIPHVQAVIIGLTESTLSFSSIEDFLKKNNVSEPVARQIARAVANIPIGAQANLPNFSKRPQKGDVFAQKNDAWPKAKAAEGKPPVNGVPKPENPWL